MVLYPSQDNMALQIKIIQNDLLYRDGTHLFKLRIDLLLKNLQGTMEHLLGG